MIRHVCWLVGLFFTVFISWHLDAGCNHAWKCGGRAALRAIESIMCTAWHYVTNYGWKCSGRVGGIACQREYRAYCLALRNQSWVEVWQAGGRHCMPEGVSCILPALHKRQRKMSRKMFWKNMLLALRVTGRGLCPACTFCSLFLLFTLRYGRIKRKQANPALLERHSH